MQNNQGLIRDNQGLIRIILKGAENKKKNAPLTILCVYEYRLSKY